jgi:hypothetical protein
VTDKNADDARTYVHWDEAALPAMQVATPTSAGQKVETPEEKLQALINVSKWNPSLTLVYFHVPHEDLEKSKLVGPALATVKQCKAFVDDNVARWLSLYHPVEIDMGKSDLQTAERLGCKDGAMLAVVDQHLNVVATSKPLATSEAVVTFLKNTLRSEACKSFWKPIEDTIAEQKATLEKARAFAKEGKWKEASEQYDLVLGSKVRIADFYDDVVREAGKASRKAKDK